MTRAFVCATVTCDTLKSARLEELTSEILNGCKVGRVSRPYLAEPEVRVGLAIGVLDLAATTGLAVSAVGHVLVADNRCPQ